MKPWTKLRRQFHLGAALIAGLTMGQCLPASAAQQQPGDTGSGTYAVSTSVAGDRVAPQSSNDWGHLQGRIVVDGPVNDPRMLTVEKDREVCLADGEIPDETVVVAKDGGLRDVYVMLYLDRGDDAPAVHPSYEEAAKQPIVLDNVRCRFVPRASFARVGQTLQMKNSDSVGHNVHTLNVSEKNKNIPAGGMVEVSYEEPDRLPADVECNIHPFMKGLLLVKDHPYVAITNAAGEFRIENLPAGKWKFQFWHKKVGYLKALQRDDKEFLGRRGEAEFEIVAGEALDLGSLKFPAQPLNAAD